MHAKKHTHKLTQEDFDLNPDLIDEGCKVGDIVTFDAEGDGDPPVINPGHQPDAED